MTVQTAVKWGDFSTQVRYYSQRPPYSYDVLRCLVHYVQDEFPEIKIAELGAGTGNLLRSFHDLDVGGYAIEPDRKMRDEAFRLSEGNNSFKSFVWREGTAEATGLPDQSVNWILIGNAYQFLDPDRTFPECRRILQASGFLTVFWNIRDFARDPLQGGIEEMVSKMVPGLKRTSLSIDAIMKGMDTKGMFKECLYVEAGYMRAYSPEGFLATWQAGGDVPSQVSPAVWRDIIAATERMIPKQPQIETLWRTHAWTFRRQ